MYFDVYGHACEDEGRLWFGCTYTNMLMALEYPLHAAIFHYSVKLV
jgi:hypothetical protein